MSTVSIASHTAKNAIWCRVARLFHRPHSFGCVVQYYYYYYLLDYMRTRTIDISTALIPFELIRHNHRSFCCCRRRGSGGRLFLEITIFASVRCFLVCPLRSFARELECESYNVHPFRFSSTFARWFLSHFWNYSGIYEHSQWRSATTAAAAILFDSTATTSCDVRMWPLSSVYSSALKWPALDRYVPNDNETATYSQLICRWRFADTIARWH